MKLLLNNKHQEIGFWSFMKCSLLTQLALMGLVWGGLLVLTLLIVI